MALSDADKAAFDAIREKHEAKKEQERNRREEKKEVPASLTVEQNEFGLYWVRQEKGGALPKVLQGMFTTKLALSNAIKSYYGENVVLN